MNMYADMELQSILLMVEILHDLTHTIQHHSSGLSILGHAGFLPSVVEAPVPIAAKLSPKSLQ